MENTVYYAHRFGEHREHMQSMEEHALGGALLAAAFAPAPEMREYLSWI